MHSEAWPQTGEIQHILTTRRTFPAMRYLRHLRALPATLTGIARIVLDPTHLKRTLLIAFVVGSWLNLFNHIDALLHGMPSTQLAAKLALDCLTPFVVANVGLPGPQAALTTIKRCFERRDHLRPLPPEPSPGATSDPRHNDATGGPTTHVPDTLW